MSVRPARRLDPDEIVSASSQHQGGDDKIREIISESKSERFSTANSEMASGLRNWFDEVNRRVPTR
jgi:hypothetical protein